MISRTTSRQVCRDSPSGIRWGTSWQQPAPDNNPLGGFGHCASHTFDSARHGVSSAGADVRNTFQQQNSFGQPGFEVPGAPGSTIGKSAPAAQHGATMPGGPDIRTSTDTGVTNPTNVWNPSSYASETGAVGSSSAPAIGASPNYAGFGSDFGREATQRLPGAVARQGLSQEVSSAFEHISPSQFFRTVAADAGEDS
jgi:hypothetical protein